MARKKITDENENVLQEEEKDSFTNSEIEVDDYNSEISVKTEEVTKDKTKKARKSLAESFNTFQNSIPVITVMKGMTGPFAKPVTHTVLKASPPQKWVIRNWITRRIAI